MARQIYAGMDKEEKENDPLYTRRHSLAHVMAAAVRRLFPGTKLGFGPAIDNGFYYDFEVEKARTKKEQLLEEEAKAKERKKKRAAAQKKK